MKNPAFSFCFLSLLFLGAVPSWMLPSSSYLKPAVARGSIGDGTPQAPLWIRMAGTAMTLWNNSGPGSEAWNYERGTLLYGFQRLWIATGDIKYFHFIQNRTDAFVTGNGSIPTYRQQDYALDSICSGLNLLFLYRTTYKEKYRIATELLQEQIRKQPRTRQGGFWHKLIYPYEMWLDGLFMAEPFRAQSSTGDFDDIAMQFIWMEKNVRDSKTGLLYHGWDEKKEQIWADPKTGTSPSFWGRGMGWYAMALVEVLELFPKDHPKQAHIVSILRRLAKAVTKVQDPESGVWWQVLNEAGRKGNYLESSASCLFVYALAKGVHEGYLAPRYLAIARLGYEGIKREFIEEGADGAVSLTQICSVASLGPGSNGSFEYYISQPVVENNAKGIGPFLLASLELEK